MSSQLVVNDEERQSRSKRLPDCSPCTKNSTPSCSEEASSNSTTRSKSPTSTSTGNMAIEISEVKLTRHFHQSVNLRTGDIYATIDESYITNSTGPTKDFSNDEQYGDGATPQKHIVATMCQNDETTSTIHFRNARRSWQASAGTGPAESTHIYRFTINDENRDSSDPGRMILQWERRSKENISAGSPDAEQFVLLLIDRGARRKSRIATMTPDGLEIFVRKPSVLETLQVCFDLTGPVVYTRVQDPYEALEMWFYMQTLTLGGMGPLPGGMAQ
ncbi:hypothetical protein BDV39DRAFT_209746 [Aspergillus sergii]|uniref:Uncharacterized protein n=1 Tax=Aspergillus sergii TaxID=1034303 RepID=A0A5N6WQF4_9EURO|nr:hypothetical protein BDV39DRAFT_209746 [Aspergillus sergii]